MTTIYNQNEIKLAIINNEKIEDKLHVIVVISNPCLYKTRYRLIREFISRIESTEPNVILYVVELVYKNQDFAITENHNKYHLQLRTSEVLWHKENLINLGVKYLLPNNWKAMAWIDGDIEFESTTWVDDTLKILNGSKDIVQLFSHCVDMNKNNETMNIFTSFSYQYCKNMKYVASRPNTDINFWHTGYGWACNRKTYEKIGGLYENAILGSGDNIISLCLIGKIDESIYIKGSNKYKDSVKQYEKNISNLRLGYVPGVIRHYYHGSKQNRKYVERADILLKYNYNPFNHISKDDKGVIIPSNFCPNDFLKDIMCYFLERNEDE